MVKPGKQKPLVSTDRGNVTSVNDGATGRVSATLIRHQGPLPAPEDLERYEQIHPGAAAAIIRMAEEEQQHRHTCDKNDMDARERHQELERLVIQEAGASNLRGQIFGAVLAVIALFGAIYCAIIGQPWVAAALVSLPVASVINAIVKPSQAEHPTEKKE